MSDLPIDPELRDLEVSWVKLPGSLAWMFHFKIVQTHGDNSTTTLYLSHKQADAAFERYKMKPWEVKP